MNKCIDWFGSHDPFDGNVLYPAVWHIGRVMTSSVKKQRKLSVGYRDVLRVFLSEMQPLKSSRMVHTLSDLNPGQGG